MSREGIIFFFFDNGERGVFFWSKGGWGVGKSLNITPLSLKRDWHFFSGCKTPRCCLGYFRLGLFFCCTCLPDRITSLGCLFFGETLFGFFWGVKSLSGLVLCCLFFIRYCTVTLNGPPFGPTITN